MPLLTSEELIYEDEILPVEMSLWPTPERRLNGAAALRDLRLEFAARGWNRKAPGRVLLGLVANLVMVAAGVAVYFLQSGSLVLTAGVVLVVAGSMGVGTNTHTSSHYATSDRKWLNEFLTYFGYPFFLGLSATWWWRQHVVVHHGSPNVIGVDGDADLAPWLARTRDEVERSRGALRFYYEHLQWLALPFLLAMNGPNMQRQGWAHLARGLREAPRRKHVYDLLALALHYLCFLLLPMLWFDWHKVAALYLLRLAFIGYLMFAVLAPGHFPAEALCRNDRPDRDEYLWLQTSSTLNYRVGCIGRLLCSGLQYQIEHHLFPELCHVHYPKVSKVVREFCLQHDLPYRTYAWDVILWKCVAMFRHPPAITRE